MSKSEIERAVRHLRAALALLNQPRPNARRDKWFRSTGHLSAAGIQHLNFLFASGKSTYAAAKEMGISYRSAALRRKRNRHRRDAVM
jgi:hypothetical protein